jgi:hypothetical protein
MQIARCNHAVDAQPHVGRRRLTHRLLDFVDEPQIACGWSNSTTMCSAVSGRALTQRVPPGPDCPSSRFSTG